MRPRRVKDNAPYRCTAQAAFTLVELLVAAGITLLLAGFIAVILRNVSTTWARAGNRLGADAQARLVLDQLQRDLQGAMFRDDGNVWLAVDVLDTTGNSGLWQTAPRNPKPTASSLDVAARRGDLSTQDRQKFEFARHGVAGQWLRFFTASRPVTNSTGTVTTPSAPVAVGYQMIRRFTATNPANQNTAYLLHRAEARPATSNGRAGVIDVGFDITSSFYTRGNNTNTGAITGDPRGIQVPGNVRNLDSVIADNVVDFGIRAYVRDPLAPGGLRLIFPAIPLTAAGELVNLGIGYNAPGTQYPTRLQASLPSSVPVATSTYQKLFPDVIDVMIRVLTDEGSTKIANIEKVQTPALTAPQKYNSNAQEWWWGVAQENSRVYTRRITLNAQK